MCQIDNTVWWCFLLQCITNISKPYSFFHEVVHSPRMIHSIMFLLHNISWAHTRAIHSQWAGTPRYGRLLSCPHSIGTLTPSPHSIGTLTESSVFWEIRSMSRLWSTELPSPRCSVYGCLLSCPHSIGTLTESSMFWGIRSMSRLWSTGLLKIWKLLLQKFNARIRIDENL